MSHKAKQTLVPHRATGLGRQRLGLNLALEHERLTSKRCSIVGVVLWRIPLQQEVSPASGHLSSEHYMQ